MNFKHSRSFTLLEIVIAMFILSVAVAGVFSLFATNYKYIIEAEHRLQAVHYGSMIAESLKVYVSADPANPTGANNALIAGNAKAYTLSGVNIAPVNAFTGISTINAPTCTYNIADNASGATGLKEAKITVTWDEP